MTHFFLNFWFCLTYNMTCIDRKFKLFVRIVSVYETNLKLKLSFGSTGALWDIVWFVVIGYKQRTASTVISQNLGGTITSHLTYHLDYFITCNIASSHSLFSDKLLNIPLKYMQRKGWKTVGLFPNMVRAFKYLYRLWISSKYRYIT